MFIKIQNLSKIYNKYLAVNKINFQIEKNKTIGLLGPNGCGKTTTIGMILGLVTPSHGEILIDNKNIKKPFWIFEVFGTNSIFLFILSGLWVKTMLLVKLTLNGSQVSAYNYLYKTLFVPILGNLNGSLFFAIFHVIGFWVILFWMQKKNIKIKL